MIHNENGFFTRKSTITGVSSKQKVTKNDKKIYFPVHRECEHLL